MLPPTIGQTKHSPRMLEHIHHATWHHIPLIHIFNTVATCPHASPPPQKKFKMFKLHCTALTLVHCPFSNLLHTLFCLSIQHCHLVSGTLARLPISQQQPNVLVYTNSSGVPRNFFRGGGVQQIQLRTEDRENGDLGAVAP